MELTREHFCAIIFDKFRRGLSREECIDELKFLFGNKAPSYSTVKNWFNEFNCHRGSLKNDVREGHIAHIFGNMAKNHFSKGILK